MLDLRPVFRPDGLYRTCLVCGEEFKLASDTIVVEIAYKSGIKYTLRVEQTANYPRALMQTVCAKCQAGAAPNPNDGARDPRARLRGDG